jgi:hypothetical protein
MQFHIGHLTKPEQCWQIVADHMLSAAPMLLRVQARVVHKRGQRGLDVLLKEVLAGEPGWVTVQRQRAVTKVTKEMIRRASEVSQEVSFGDGVAVGSGWPEDAIRVADRDAYVADG